MKTGNEWEREDGLTTDMRETWNRRELRKRDWPQKNAENAERARIKKSGVRSQNGYGDRNGLRTTGWHPKKPLFPPNSGYFRQFGFFYEKTKQPNLWQRNDWQRNAKLSGKCYGFFRDVSRFYAFLRTDQGRGYAIVRIFTGRSL